MDRGASVRVWVAYVERFFMEMVKNVTTCASQSWLQVSVWHFGLQMWSRDCGTGSATTVGRFYNDSGIVCDDRNIFLRV